MVIRFEPFGRTIRFLFEGTIRVYFLKKLAWKKYTQIIPTSTIYTVYNIQLTKQGCPGPWTLRAYILRA